jgi:hypothetical protein
MAKGEQRGNREAKKPKKEKPSPLFTPSCRDASTGNYLI